MKKEAVYLRHAVLEDKDLLYQWRNDFVCRKNSVNQEEVLYDSHCAWFLSRLDLEECLIFVCMDKDTPVGQIRVDYQDGNGKISYSVSASCRGKGYGTRMLELLEQDAEVQERTLKLFAVVKSDNKMSQRCFEKLQYLREKYDGYFCYSKIL